MVKEDLTPRKIISRESLLNGIILTMGIAGSTNAVLHLLSLARDLDTDLDLDDFDRKIIAALREDGRMPVTAIAARVGLSKTPCQIRMKRLVESGVIREAWKAAAMRPEIPREVRSALIAYLPDCDCKFFTAMAALTGSVTTRSPVARPASTSISPCPTTSPRRSWRRLRRPSAACT